jgi:hypothetical protein
MCEKNQPWERATVKFINNKKGFCRLIGINKEKIILRLVIFRKCGLVSINTGDELFVRYKKDDKGLIAIDVISSSRRSAI